MKALKKQLPKIILQKVSINAAVPHQDQFQIWAKSVLPINKLDYELVIRIVDIKEITLLNKRYRKKNSSTNIISFAVELPKGVKIKVLGDLVICAPLAIKEAKLQGKPAIAHWAHLTIHGILHLLGYDHQHSKAAKLMESLEIKSLKKLGFSNPYLG